MENEGNFMELTDESIGAMSPEQAQTHIDRVNTAAGADLNHPYTSSSNLAAHRKAVENMTKLFGRARPQPDLVQVNSDGQEIVGEFPADVVNAMAEGLDIQAGRDEATQAKLIGEGEAEMQTLEELGFDAEAIPDNVMPYQVRGLKEQRLLAQSKEGDDNAWQELGRLVNEDFSRLGADSASRSMLAQLFATTNPKESELASKIANTIAKHIYTIQNKE